MEILEILAELIKYTAPALVVFYLMRQWQRGHYHNELLRIKSTMSNDQRAVRMQAYERLVLFCERIDITSLLMRLDHAELNADQLRSTILITIQKEHEHNITQQIYVSRELWEMVGILKDNTSEVINGDYLKAKKDGKEAVKMSWLESSNALQPMANKVKDAIRQEVQTYFQ